MFNINYVFQQMFMWSKLFALEMEGPETEMKIKKRLPIQKMSETQQKGILSKWTSKDFINQSVKKEKPSMTMTGKYDLI